MISLTETAAILVGQGPSASQKATRLLERAAELAHRHHLSELEWRVAVQQWRLDERPALSGARARAFLAVLGGEPSGATRVPILNQLGHAAWSAGWSELGTAACMEATADEALACDAAICDDVLTLLTPFQARPKRIRRLLEERSECPGGGLELFRRTVLAAALHRTGDRAGALLELERARDLVKEGSLDRALFVQAVELLVAEHVEPELDVFDALAKSLGGEGTVDHRNWVSEAYRDLILQSAHRDASPDELWALLQRREKVRVRGQSLASFPPEAEPLALLPVKQGELLVLTRSSAVITQPDVPPETLLDLASTEAGAWINGADLGPSQKWLSSKLGLSDGDGLLLQVGSSVELGLPLATVPGLDRPTAQWIPRTTDTLEWSTGVVLSGTNDGGAALYGIHELTDAMGRAGWATGHANSLAELTELVRDKPVVHITAHGRRVGRARVAMMLGPDLLLDANTMRTLPLMPGSLVTLAACETGGGTGGDVTLDLPFAAFQAGAAAVIYSRFPVRSVPLHKATERLYRQLPLPCAELPRRWHQIRKDYGRQLLGVEIGVSASCLADTE